MRARLSRGGCCESQRIVRGNAGITGVPFSAPERPRIDERRASFGSEGRDRKEGWQEMSSFLELFTTYGQPDDIHLVLFEEEANRGRVLPTDLSIVADPLVPGGHPAPLVGHEQAG
jgi:hypothetical protein